MTRALPSLSELQPLLEHTFTEIQRTRMTGVPVVNAELSVNAGHFIEWQGYYLGVLITPWFMNLMLLPANEETRDDLNSRRVATKQTHSFPSGAYEFITGAEDAIGHFQSCSLFSPMFEFQDQQAAIETAAAVMAGLMDVDNFEDIDAQGQPFPEYGPEPAPEADNDSCSEADTVLESPLTDKVISRRQLLSGFRG